MEKYHHIPLEYRKPSAQEILDNSTNLFNDLNKRRSVREFSNEPVDKQIIENIIKAASTAPSGANKQPWHFCAVSSQELKDKIRKAAEEEEKLNYSKRMNEEWLEDLAPLGTDWQKPFLSIAPWLIIMTKKVYDIDENQERSQNYYVNESVGIACGFLLSAIHQAGLVSLTHTPSPMNFLTKLLGRPENEKAYMLIPIGYPAKDTTVPDIKRKELEKISSFY
ncbi:nitroreductase family protein [Aureibacter tunicatorum]|uniref:Nitroreductase n=1 Tax=Aureibacter tunicatorum TaxID=866807 RepID=A0AAE4BU63_9BACT|nr:nitroreductase family protein [Aureibacter tunicatorum]MDR6240715.1 nitroreductase [Aureibacter tunicatorum]BDD06952.1 oxidoreductase [Aureibacter tunicatorum]